MSVTLLFTDIEGSTRLVQELGDAYPDALEEHRRIVRAAIAETTGSEIDCRGDELAAEGGPRVILVSSHDVGDFGRLVARSGAAGFIPKAELSGAAISELIP